MYRGYLRGVSIALLFFLQGIIGPAQAQQGRKWQRVLIETRKPYDDIVRAVEVSGGRVTQQFKYIDAIAAEVGEETVPGLSKLPGVQAILEDFEVQRPATIDSSRVGTAAQAQGTAVSSGSSVRRKSIPSKDVNVLAAAQPQIYSINSAETRIENLHALGLTGNGVVVAVIDSGFRSGFDLGAQAVIGGMDFVDDGAPGPAGDSQADWKKAGNDGHGTFAVGLIAGKTSFTVSGVLKSALEQYAPGAIVDGQLPLIGTAPDSQIYVVRVFGDDPNVGSPLSTIIAAMEHVIQQRELYDSTQGKKGLNIEVANLSLAISTLAAGQSQLDVLADRMLAAGIVPVVSIGNVGPSAITTSSPGTSRSALTVGGSSPAANERILNEVHYATQQPGEYYRGIGGDIRPYSGTETAWFSSRGPNADGRLIPDIVATGVGNIGQGYCPDQTLIVDACFANLSIGSGTSFSSPIVSGIAAVLVGAFPDATATQIRNALIASANTGKIEPYFDSVDRGHGLVDAYAAYLLLASHRVPDSPPFTVPWDLPVEDNIEQNPGLIVKSGTLTEIMTGLKPGQRGEVLYAVPPDTDRVIVRIRNVEMTGSQNPFFGGDRMFFYVHSAKTSRAVGNYLVEGELFAGGEPEKVFELTNPDTGVMRVTVNPDTFNAGQVNATVRLQTIPRSISSTRVIDDTISNNSGGDEQKIKTYTHNVDPKTKSLEFVLTWDHDWAHYPTSDVDLIVCSPDIAAADCRTLGNKQGATLASPERVIIDKPAAGTWTLKVNGFNVPTQSGTDHFRLRIKETP
jgi:hypothetical protein